MSIFFWCCLIVLLFGLSGGRRARRKAFDLQRIMGDVIAIRNGTFVKRYIRKQLHKRSGSTINKLRKLKP
jgi:hypothetical protein